jgi:2-C-methyl-D-erythritol 4-phosphate cytidylyltransferase
MNDVWGIVVAGGQGERFGEPKQFLPLGNARMIDHAVNAISNACNAVVVVLPAGTPWDGAEVARSVPGGESRAASVRAGLAVVPDDAEIVVVHDAARPLAAAPLFRAVIEAVRAGADGAVPGLPVTDTVKRVDGDLVIETVAREGLTRVQTPQAFRATCLRSAHATEPDATDDAGLVEAAGAKVVVVPGDERNLKVTTADDLVVAAALLASSGLPPVGNER